MTEDNTSKNDGYGIFGNLSKTYDEIRPSIPPQIVDYIFTNVDLENPKILDVGCGTGIVTRQLSTWGKVTGADKDARMIEQAMQRNEGNIVYNVAPTENLPFDESTFDLVTAFSAFHWFANEQAISEVRRVLKKGGVFFIANRNQTGDIRKEYLETLKTFTNEKLPNIKKDFQPAQLLRKGQFRTILERKFPSMERLSLGETLRYVQSTSLWNLVPKGKKQEAMLALKSFFKERTQGGLVHRPVEIHTIMAQK